MKSLASSGNPSAWIYSNGVSAGNGDASAEPVIWSESATVSGNTSTFYYITGNSTSWERWALVTLKAGVSYEFYLEAYYGPVHVDVCLQSSPGTVLTTFRYYDTNRYTPAADGNYLLRIYENYSDEQGGTYLSCTPPPERTTGEAGWITDDSRLSLKGMSKFGRIESKRTLAALGLIQSANNRDTMFYLDGSSQSDVARGAATPNNFTLSSVTFNSDNHLVFADNGSGCLDLPDFDTTMFGAGKEWTMDCCIKLSGNLGSYNNLWTQTNNRIGDAYRAESIGFGIDSSPKFRNYYPAADCGIPFEQILSDTVPTGKWMFVAVDKFQLDGVWHLCYYLDGEVLFDCPLTKEILSWRSSKPCFFSSDDDGGRRFRGTVAKPRITAKALYRGKPFQVEQQP